MDKQIIRTSEAVAPTGCYSQAVKVGQLLFISGTIALDPVSGKVVEPGNIEAQIRQVMENIKTVLKAAETSLDSVVKVTAFIDDIDKFNSFDSIYREYFPKDPPARSTVEVGHFPKGICVEIEAIALTP